MGGGNSVEVYRDIVLRSTVDIVTKTTQSIGRETMQTQELKVNCEGWVAKITREYNTCLELNRDRTAAEAKELCSQILSLKCGAEGINMEQSLYIMNTAEMYTLIRTEVTNALQNDLVSNIESNSGFLQFGNKYTQETKNLVESATRAWQEIKLESMIKDMQKQILELVGGGTVSLVTMSQTSDRINKELLANETYASAVNDVANRMTEEFNASFNWKKIAITVGCSVGALLLIGLLIYFLRPKTYGGALVNVTYGGPTRV